MGRDGERSDEELVLGAVGSRLALERGCSMRSIAMTGCTILFEILECYLRDLDEGLRHDVQTSLSRLCPIYLPSCI